MESPGPHGSARRSYDAVAEDYAARFGGELAAKPLDRALLSSLIEQNGNGMPIADLGCGPGHVTAWLAGHGARRPVGIDLSAHMVAVARREHPGIEFREEHLLKLSAEDGEFGAVVAFYSVIHLEPGEPRCAIQIMASSCPSSAGVPLSAKDQPTNQAPARKVSEDAATSIQPTGRGKEVSNQDPRIRRTAPRTASVTAGLPWVALRLRRAAFLIARRSPADGAEPRRPARDASTHVATATSATGSNGNGAASSADISGATGCPVTTLTARNAATAAQPTAVTIAMPANSSEPAGLASQAASRVGGGAGGAHGQTIRVVHAVPSHHRSNSDPAGSGTIRPEEGERQPGPRRAKSRSRSRPDANTEQAGRLLAAGSGPAIRQTPMNR